MHVDDYVALQVLQYFGICLTVNFLPNVIVSSGLQKHRYPDVLSKFPLNFFILNLEFFVR